MKLQTLLACLFAALPIATVNADWYGFRGSEPNSAADTKLPSDLDDEKVLAWKMEIPGRGASSPIVVKDKVIVTCSSGYRQDRLHVVCFDVKTGKQAWHRQFWATGRTLTHPFSANAAPTPVSDGESIFAFYSSNDLICLDLDGNLQWYRGLGHDRPKAGNDTGMASSPVVVDGAVIVQVENQGDSFAAGIDAKTGQSLWSIDRHRGSNWSSPIVFRPNAKETVVVLKDRDGLSAHEPRTGKQVWDFEADAGGIASVAVVGNRLYVPAEGLLVLEHGENSPAPSIAWESGGMRSGSASPIVSRDKVMVVNSAGVITCGDVKSGDTKWKLRLKGKVLGDTSSGR